MEDNRTKMITIQTLNAQKEDLMRQLADAENNLRRLTESAIGIRGALSLLDFQLEMLAKAEAGEDGPNGNESHSE